MAEFRMPSLGADMRTGTLVAWRAKPGDHLKYGDIIADVETDKGIMEIEVFENCTVEELLLEPDTKVPVGTPMARLKLENGAEKEAIAVTDREQPSPPPTIEAPTIPVPTLAKEERLRVSPLARKVATELGVDLTQVKGTGADGAIHQIDVEEAAKALKPTPKPEEKVIPPSPEAKPTTTDFQAGMRRAIAAAMSRSNREIPHYYLETRIDMSHALKWLEAENQKRSIKERILPVVLLIKAVAKALTDVPELNGYWIEDQLKVQEAIHIGFAISLRQGGLVTPAIHHADLKSLDELMATMRDLIERTRGGHLRSSELSDATMTLTSLGDIGVEKVYGVIYPPQVALVGFGKISEQPWAEQGMLDVRPVLVATLAGDHRATDGMIGARFLQAVNTHLQSVEKW
ncbi:PdhC protein [Leptolyngbya boryana NIES-2135]|jgi:pyruvate dehydrogenase E2 component (dihydrolipoamide acetyltransferase)|uniref:Dihydrolipoamide acetyltransferase component of pyruvate dehydrogenase complex n=1 Tax=Leptolyngbya boryana NIES-2135 TaxID=1973484 RepID=A0A1Z4JQU2_LEPBY|nr:MULTISPECIES: dihydrolipoamide acetyltransferase family protein [Leptolyngbya]BAY59033.1 PdhC protein [Leptolyngbya boryana NIES-2135]MBD2368218.1 2-oxo acid dehydrogenase subunit E2 [Leptolyngbya sp. FACHB-161]MBD2374744.1 2-oxo acid dehydrogenase subunit E2 [Leptolyngbya sp. FACHB-238]MBD2399166.1 2-oxo acid dehydrogenase subunit E2 [Leptolyngbya sp. FACHB-239]MBD2405172.1 2-oxo acid dehydrogenase subunit E2 [Leptolyngbya sp. FACHB-402]